MIPFEVTFTDDPAELEKDPVLFRPMDSTLKSPEAKQQHYCALFMYLITAEGVWEPGKSLDGFMPEETRTMAKEYLCKNDELSSWFLDQHEEAKEFDSEGNVVNFQSIKDITALYQGQPIFTSMRKEDQRVFTGKKLKDDFEKNIRLKSYFVKAKKVRLASTGQYNTKEGIIHHKRKRDDDDDDD